MKLLNTIRIFLWLKIKETWKMSLFIIGLILYMTFGFYTEARLLCKFGGLNNNFGAAWIIVLFCNIIFGSLIIGLMCEIKEMIVEMIPVLKLNWIEAKKIAEKIK